MAVTSPGLNWSASLSESGTEKTLPAVGVRFTRANARSSTFELTDWKSAAFDGADLSNSKFLSCKLKAADFSNALLERAILVGADLTDSSLKRADLREANVANANLRNADFTGANLAGCNLKGAKLNSATLDKAKNFDRGACGTGGIGPALTELDSHAGAAQRIAILMRVDPGDGDGDDLIEVNSHLLRFPWYQPRLPRGLILGGSPSRSGRTLSNTLVQIADVLGSRKVRFESIAVESSRSPMSGKALRELVLRGLGEAFGQPLPGPAELRRHPGLSEGRAGKGCGRSRATGRIQTPPQRVQEAAGKEDREDHSEADRKNHRYRSLPSGNGAPRGQGKDPKREEDAQGRAIPAF